MDLRLEKIAYTYPGISRPALVEITLCFRPGEKVAIIGRNGSGKSTLMLITNGILRPQQGAVLLDDAPVQYDRRTLARLRRRVGVVFQNPDDQLFSASVMQDISLGPLNLGMSPSEARRRVLEVAKLCELTELLERPTHALSGGEKARAALAGILAMDPEYLFADEITNSLDPWMRAQVMRILDRWVEQKHTVILSTHDWNLASRWAERIIWMEHGQVYREGASQEVIPEMIKQLGEINDAF